MKTTFLILALIFTAVSSLYAKFKKSLAEDGDITVGGHIDSQDEELRPTFFDEAFDADPMAASPINAGTSARSQSIAKDVVVKPTSQLSPSSPQFDLRTAVLAQTILTAPYIDEYNQ